MHRIKPIWLFALYGLLDLFCIGLGMGIPIFCIGLGFPVGWLVVRLINAKTSDLHQLLCKILLYAGLTSAVTMLGMVIIWGPTVTYLFDPSRDLANFGIPMILYEAEASFIGWLALMIVISPFLQFLTTLFGAHLALLLWAKQANLGESSV